MANDNNGNQKPGAGWKGDSEGHQEAGKKAAETVKEEYGDEFYQEIGSLGGSVSPGQFQPGDPRTREAAKKGGEARADDPDVKSGELGKKGAEARWGSNDDRDEAA